VLDDAQCVPKVLGGKPLHPDEEAAAMTGATGPTLDVGIDLLPAAEVEVPHAEVRSIRKPKGLLEGGEERLFDVVENPRHLGRDPPRWNNNGQFTRSERPNA